MCEWPFGCSHIFFVFFSTVFDKTSYASGRLTARVKRPQSARKPPWASWSRTGKNWHHATIRGIICNLTYTGVLCSGESRSQVLPHLQLISQDRWTVSFVWKCILRPLWGAAGPLQHKTKISFPKKRDFCITLVIGGDKRDRTADLLNAIQALSRIIWCTTPDVRESAWFYERPLL